MRLGLLICGKLGMMTLENSYHENVISFVMTDRKSDKIISFCEHKAIPFFIGNPREGRCSIFLENKNVDVIASINYLYLIDNDIIKKAKKLAFNIHGSLLPKYRGRTPHVWAIINGEKYTGITAHAIDESCDTGDILIQKKININTEQTGNDILNIFLDEYIPIFQEVLEQLKQDKLNPIKQNIEEATYFGKRNPEDGHINWSWYKSRIYNWVRAQAYPYPGAFCFCEGEKIIIDKIKYSNKGFDSSIKNGTVLDVDSNGRAYIKTTNGVLALLEVRTKYKLLKGKLLE